MVWMLQNTHVGHKGNKADRQKQTEEFKTGAFSGRTA